MELPAIGAGLAASSWDLTWVESWGRVAAVGVAGAVAYVVLVAALRLAGKRALAKYNAFDFVVTIAVGSTLATVVVSRQVPVADGVAAILLLVVLQVVVAGGVRRWRFVERLVTSRPTALVVRGELRSDALSRTRVSVADVAAAVRSKGHGSFDDVDLVVLEADGSMSVIADRGDGSATRDVEGP